MNGSYKSYILVSLSIVLSAAAQLAMKAGMVHLLAVNTAEYRSIAEILQNPQVPAWVLAGLGCYAVSLLCWMAAITRLELSFAYPMLSLSYVLVYIVAGNWPLLNEQVSLQRSLGIAIVIAGVVMIARSSALPKDPGSKYVEADKRRTAGQSRQ